MSVPAIFILALGLAMDATAVAATRGLAVKRIRAKHVVMVALFFGGFQALMPLVGWLVGARIGPYVEAWDHWIAFTLLAALGGKMLWEARKHDEERIDENRAFDLVVMLGLAVATSIDALAAGFTLPMLGAPLALAIAIIGLTTATLSALGLFAGRRFGDVLGRRLDVVGGLALIGLGIKILVEHLA